MNFEALDKIAKAYMNKRKSHKERESGFVYQHGSRTAKIAVTLRKLITDDASHDELLLCAGMFHDVGKGLGEHGESGANIARFALSKELDKAELDEVCRLIASHNKREPNTDKWDIWARIMQDADILDHFGSMEIWINFHYYAHTDGSFMDSVDFYRREFPKEVSEVRALINFDVSRRIFDEKIAFVRAFANRMEIEGEGEIVSIT